MTLSKVLVIGSTGHQHVQCIDWQNVNAVNVVDFDAVVVHIHSCHPDTIKQIYMSSIDFFEVFCRFLSGEVSGEAILDRITNAVGVVKFDDL